MKTVTVTCYVAFDGLEFDDADQCRAHEARLAHMRLVGITLEQVEAAIARTDVELADAIETVGAAIRRARVQSCELKRKRLRGATAKESDGRSPETRIIPQEESAAA